jgi:hypothetical protein
MGHLDFGWKIMPLKGVPPVPNIWASPIYLTSKMAKLLIPMAHT